MLTPEQFAKSRQVSKSTVVRLCREGRLPCENYATGKQRAKWRIPADSKVDAPKPAVVVPPAVATRRVRRRAASSVTAYLPTA